MNSDQEEEEEERFERIRKENKDKIDAYLKRNIEERRKTRRGSKVRKDPRGRKKSIDPVAEDVTFRNFLRDMFYPDGYFCDSISPFPWILAVKAVIQISQ